MRNELEIEEFKQSVNLKNISEKKKQFKIAAFEGCIPKDFWYVKKENIKYNKIVFKKTVLKYVKNLELAYRKGYGLVFFGNNGTGKTFFMSYILTRAILKNKTVYYTTLPQLSFDIKRGFDDKKISAQVEYMLTSDFVAIDEIGKEQIANSKFMVSQIERILKRRFDDCMPTLLSANIDRKELSEIYGTSVESLLIGKYRMVQFDSGDYRKVLANRMAGDMGF
jgi:DNA replication protein DnaC